MKIINKLDTYIIANKLTTVNIEKSFKNSFNLMLKAGKLAATTIDSLYSKRKTLMACLDSCLSSWKKSNLILRGFT